MEMIELRRRKPGHWSGQALVAVFAATAALATGTQALAPAPAAALISGECGTGQSSDACQDSQGGGPADAPPADASPADVPPADAPGEVIVVTDSKPPEQPDFPPEKPVKVPPVDLGTLLGDTLGSGGGAKADTGEGRQQARFNPWGMQCGRYLGALRDAVIAEKNAPNRNDGAKAKALTDRAWDDYQTCQDTIAGLSPLKLGSIFSSPEKPGMFGSKARWLKWLMRIKLSLGAPYGAGVEMGF